ncbi:MAG TPA: HNH endonuclease, partial [Ornithinimicrobium sp.]|nr:HNH endonuclease [Ornithinimicrobium sp.]
LAYEVDPAGFMTRARRAAADRGVSLRPAPDVMGLLCARLPAAQAIATPQVLRTHAAGARAAGDPRTLNQLMADELVARVTGRTVVDGIDVEIGLVLTDATLLAGDSAAADLTGYGPLPADLARELLTPTTDTQDTDTQDVPDDHDGTGNPQVGDDHDGEHHAGDEDRPARGRQQAPGPCPAGGRCTDAGCTAVHGGTPPGPPPPTLPTRTRSTTRPATGSTTGAGAPGQGGRAVPGPDPGVARAARVWLRRLYADPVTGTLTVRDPRRRVFTGTLRATLIARGRYCAHAWCGAPIRHLDHITRYRDGGTTTADNARGLCARCNLAREHPRHTDPPPETYQDPPPLLDTFHGRPPANAPPPRTDDAHDDEDDPLRRSA